MEHKEKKKMPKWLAWTLLAVVVLALVALYFWLRQAGYLKIFESQDALQAYMGGFGIWAPLVFFLLQTAQVIAAPIPGNVTALAGGAMFGFWQAFWIGTAATLVGSAIAFGLAKLFGRPLVVRLVGEATVTKYVDVFAKKSTFLLAAMFLIPFFPDDALCLIAGLTAIRWLPFLLIVIITRPPGLVVSTLVGSGALVIPIWGWVLIGLAAAALMFASFKYGDKINDWIMGKLRRNG